MSPLRLAAVASALAAATAFSLAQTSPTTNRPEAPDSGNVRTTIHVELAPMSFDGYAQAATDLVLARVAAIHEVTPGGGGIAYRSIDIDVLASAYDVIEPGPNRIVLGGLSGPNARVVLKGAPDIKEGQLFSAFLTTDRATGTTGIFGLERGFFRVSGLDASMQASGSILNQPLALGELFNRALLAREAAAIATSGEVQK